VKKVCFFNTSKTWGGGEKWHFDIAHRLGGDHIAVQVATFPGSELAERARGAGLPVAEFSVGKFSFLNPFLLWRLVRFFRREKITTVILNLPADLKAAGVSAWLAGVPQIVYRRGSAIPIKPSLLNRFLFRRVVTDVIANSEETKRTVLARKPDLFPADRIRVIYNGIDLEAFDAGPVPPLYQRREGEIVLGHAGRLSYEKNQSFLLEVVRLLKDAGVKCRLLIAGKGPMEADLRARCQTLGLDEEIVFLGFQSEIRSFMEAIDIFLLCSLWEGFGYVLVEAMAASTPVVAFAASSTPEVVQDQVSGLLVPAGDKAAFFAALLELIRNPEQRAKLGSNGRRRVEQVFDVRRTLAEVKALIR
jgi:glycosyltransferase involved in cell wall biosynthesis